MKAPENAVAVESARELGEALGCELAGGVIGGGGQVRERPGQVAPFVDAVQLAGAEDRIEDGGAPAGVGMADKKVIFLADCTDANGVLDGVGIDVQMPATGFGKTRQLRPAFEGIVDGLGQRAVRQDGRIDGGFHQRLVQRHQPGGRARPARLGAGLRRRRAQFLLDAVQRTQISQKRRRPVVASLEGLDKTPPAMRRMESFPYGALCCGLNMRENCAVPL